MTVFPYRSADAGAVLAVADPTDHAAQRAAEIVLGADVAIKVASFEDITDRAQSAFGQRERRDSGRPLRRFSRAKTTSRVCGTSPAARPWFAPSTISWKKPSNCARATFTSSPLHAGLVVRMRIDGLLRAVAAPAGVLPQAVISRIKIVASLNIAERRLPQDGSARLRVGRSDIDIRVAIMPTQHGESAVIRILPKDRGLLVIEKLGFSAGRRCQDQAIADAAARHDRHHRADRKRQDHDACDGLVDPERTVPENPDHRGSGRVRNSRGEPVADQARDRTDICRGAAFVRSSGSGCHHGWRGARFRDRACRRSRSAHRTSRADDAAHRNGGGRGAASARSRRRGISACARPCGR